MEEIRCGKMRQSKNAFYQDLDFSKIAFRSSLVLGLVALVILVLYFSPLPGKSHIMKHVNIVWYLCIVTVCMQSLHWFNNNNSHIVTQNIHTDITHVFVVL